MLVVVLAVACAKTTDAVAVAQPPVSPPAAPPSPTASVTAQPTASASPPTPIAPPALQTGAVRRGCHHKGYATPSGAKPAITVAMRGTMLDVTLDNRGTAPVCLYASVAANGEHFDWMTVVIDGGPGPRRNLTFVDDRNRSAPISYELGPGSSLTKKIDLDAWARRRINGGRPLAPGGYTVSLDYSSVHETWAWAGNLHATTTILIH
ncbi:hypothetical protein BH09MYX1_BH09MYX1_16040 [soil metagenome]